MREEPPKRPSRSSSVPTDVPLQPALKIGARATRVRHHLMGKVGGGIAKCVASQPLTAPSSWIRDQQSSTSEFGVSQPSVVRSSGRPDNAPNWHSDPDSDSLIVVVATRRSLWTRLQGDGGGRQLGAAAAGCGRLLSPVSRGP